MTDVVTRDVLPPHTELIKGSIKYVDARGSVALQDGPLFQSGYNAGKYDPSENSLIVFKTKVLGNFEECEKRVRNVAYAHSKQFPKDIRDDADVVIKKEKCDKPEKPRYACDLLTATKTGKGREVKFNVSASASGGAEVMRYVYSFGDGSEEFTTDNDEVTYTYAKDGQYAARVKVQVRVDGQTRVAESDKCAAAVTFTTPPTTTPTPVTPGKLPETGAGSIVATFLAVTGLSTVGFHIVSRRFARF